MQVVTNWYNGKTAHHCAVLIEPPMGFEPMIGRLRIDCSSQLSHGGDLFSQERAIFYHNHKKAVGKP